MTTTSACTFAHKAISSPTLCVVDVVPFLFVLVFPGLRLFDGLGQYRDWWGMGHQGNWPSYARVFAFLHRAPQIGQFPLEGFPVPVTDAGTRVWSAFTLGLDERVVIPSRLATAPKPSVASPSVTATSGSVVLEHSEMAPPSTPDGRVRADHPR